LFLYLDHIHCEIVYKQNDEQVMIYQHREIPVGQFDDVVAFIYFYLQQNIKLSLKTPNEKFICFFLCRINICEKKIPFD